MDSLSGSRSRAEGDGDGDRAMDHIHRVIAGEEGTIQWMAPRVVGVGVASENGTGPPASESEVDQRRRHRQKVLVRS
jgi:hypothetical protein